MQPDIPHSIIKAVHLVHLELLFKTNQRALQEQLYNIYNMDIIISASFSAISPVQVHLWISDLTSVYQAKAVEWIEPGNNFMTKLEKVAEKNIDRLYQDIKRREESRRWCYCCRAPGHIARNCPNPSWVSTTLTAHEEVNREQNIHETPVKEDQAVPTDQPTVINKCNVCKDQPKCMCGAVTQYPDRDPSTNCPEDLEQLSHQLEDL